MRERITYVQKLGDSLEPSAVTVDGGGINGPEVHAVREDRLTIALDELPLELQALVTGAQDLHIRWVNAAGYGTVSPLLARVPPGFHLFFTPGRDDAVSDKLCPVLADIFGGRLLFPPCCKFAQLVLDGSQADRSQDPFTSAHNGGFQYFQELNGLTHFIQYAKGKLCRPVDSSCLARLDTLSKAGSLDISYDTTRSVLQVTALWPYQRQRVHAISHPRLRTEVGILSTDKPKTLEAHEIGISGLLTVLGQDPKPSPTMFSFASRHRDAESTFSAQFLTPTGLHPTLQLRLASNNLPLPEGHDQDGSTCTPYAYLTLPRTIIADKYQLSDPLFLASKNLTALRYTTQPVDLEAPEYAMTQWGSAVLLQLSPPPVSSPHSSQPPKAAEGGDEWTAEIPFHLRYLAPARGGYATASVPYPAVFWACEPEQEVVFPPNPFEKAHLGGGLLVNEVKVPVLDLDKAGWVNAGTAAAVLVGFAWVVWKLAAAYMRGGSGRRVEGEGERAKKRQ